MTARHASSLGTMLFSFPPCDGGVYCKSPDLSRLAGETMLAIGRSLVPASCLFVSLAVGSVMAAEKAWQSHAPQRPLPQPSQRALDAEALFFVALDGDDTSAGSKEKP